MRSHMAGCLEVAILWNSRCTKEEKTPSWSPGAKTGAAVFST
jgi:hypothetical protein